MSCLEPLCLGRDTKDIVGEDNRKYFHNFVCEKYGIESTEVDAYIILRNSPVKPSYVISNPCIRKPESEDDAANCCKYTGKNDECMRHYLKLIHLADTGVIPLEKAANLKRGKTYIAELPQNLYWKFIQIVDGNRNCPRERKKLFLSDVRKVSGALEEKILNDITTHKEETRMKLVNFVRERIPDIGKIKFNVRDETKRYSIANGIGDVLQALELIRSPELIPLKTESDGLFWYFLASTSWDSGEYVVMTMDSGGTNVDLINSDIRSDTEVNDDGSRISGSVKNLLKGTKLSPKESVATLANMLDDHRWLECTGKEPPKVFA
ncbi:MAG: hypothetical protein PHU12_03305 [Candidatus Aenigmarchaeota archaeon]|nr:hypothetical protein [Candidatus Aenigmarchaeota archaeon]